MSKRFIPITTADIRWYQNLPFSVQYNDIYYSVADGLSQSRHVFIDGNDLIERFQALPADSKRQFVIAETGFGTGLNFLLSWHLWIQNAPKSASLRFISCEQHPLSYHDLLKSLENWPQLKEESQEFLANYPILTPGFHQLSFANGRVQLTLMLGDVLDCYEQLLICGEPKLEANLRTAFVDAWYLDGFSPQKNERMWSENLCKIIAMLSKEGSSLASYTVASVVKNNLIAQGFSINKRKGYGPKRHMLSAVYTQNLAQPLKQKHTPWHALKPQTYPNKTAIIIGAGLAGCFTAYALAKRGWEITVIEERSGVGLAASANEQAVLFPKLSAYQSPLTQFMLSAYLYASKFYKNILSEHDFGELTGSLIVPHNAKERLAQAGLSDWLQRYPELGVLVDCAQASILSGIPLSQSGLFIPDSGWINSPSLCHVLLDNPGIKLVKNTKIERIETSNTGYQVNEMQASVLILCNGNQVNQFVQTKDLPIKSIRGQMTAIAATPSSNGLKIPLCADGHVLPAYLGVHNIGASYDLGNATSAIVSEDDLDNIAKINKLPTPIQWSSKVSSHWAGVRASTPDYLPLVGPVPDVGQFLTLFKGFESNAKRWIAKPGEYYSGLFACAGFGSRGLTTIPLSAEYLASLINKEIPCLPRQLIQALSPARFIKRDLSRGIEKPVLLEHNNTP